MGIILRLVKQHFIIVLVADRLEQLPHPEVAKRFYDYSAVMETDVNGMPFDLPDSNVEEENTQLYTPIKRANDDVFQILNRMLRKRKVGTDRMNHLIRFSKRNLYQK